MQKQKTCRLNVSFPDTLRKSMLRHTFSFYVAVLMLLFALSDTVSAQTIGPSPPDITMTVNVTSGTTTVVGNTVISTTGTTAATNVTSGTLVFDCSAGTNPGPINVQTTSGNALNAAGGTIFVPNGNVSIQTTVGHAVLASGATSTVTIADGATITTTAAGVGLVAIGGTVNATGVVVNNTNNGHGAVAESGGTVNLYAGTSITTGGAFNAVGLGASGTDSKIIPDELIPVTTTGRGAMGVYMHDGGQVALLPASTLQMNGNSSVGVTVDNTTVASGTIGVGLKINLNGAGVAGQAGSTGIAAVNSGNISIENVTVTGQNAAAGALAHTGSTININNSSIDINAAQNQIFYTLSSFNLVTNLGSMGSIFTVTSISPISGLFTTGGTINSTGTQINVTSNNNAVGVFSGNGGTVNLTNNTITTSGANSFGIRVDNGGKIIGNNSSITTSGGATALLFSIAGGNIELTDCNVLASGTGTTGLDASNLSASSLNTLTISGGSLVSEASTAMVFQGPADISIDNGCVITGGDGNLVSVFNNTAGFQQTEANINTSAGSILTGDALAQNNSILNIRLKTLSHWTGAADNSTNIDLDATSQWDITGTSTLTGTMTNAGTVRFTGTASNRQLTFNSANIDYGTIGINVNINDDTADRLVVDGGTISMDDATLNINILDNSKITRKLLIVEAVNGGSIINSLPDITISNPDYLCTLEIENGNMYLNITYISVINIIIQPSGSDLCAGSYDTLSVVTDGTGHTYQWYKDGSLITGATSNKYVIANAQKSHNGTYTVTVTSVNGVSVTSVGAEIKVTNDPVVIVTNLPTNITLSASPAILQIAATGDSLKYQWKYNGEEIPGATSESLKIYEEGYYQVSITGSGPCGVVNSNLAYVTFEYIDIVINRKVTLQQATGVITNPFAGVYYVESREDFVFEMWPESGYAFEDVKVTTDKGNEVSLSPALSQGEGANPERLQVTVKRINTTTTITIKGAVESNSQVGEMPVQQSAPKVWSYKGKAYFSLPIAADVAIYSISGTLHDQRRIPAGDTSIAIPPGFYIIRISGMAETKIVIN